jgi:L-fucose mutarotase/ribose pyranase (RbsD/FucU family)
MIWLDLNLKRSIAWVSQSYLANLVRLKDFQLIHLINMVFKFLNADTMVAKTVIFMASGIEQIEEVITSQVIQMIKRLKALQV